MIVTNQIHTELDLTLWSHYQRALFRHKHQCQAIEVLAVVEVVLSYKTPTMSSLLYSEIAPF